MKIVLLIVAAVLILIGVVWRPGDQGDTHDGDDELHEQFEPVDRSVTAESKADAEGRTGLGAAAGRPFSRPAQSGPKSPTVQIPCDVWPAAAAAGIRSRWIGMLRGVSFSVSRCRTAPARRWTWIRR